MNKIEELELELKARKMVEGTGLDWWNVIKNGIPFKFEPYFDSPRTDYELALGIIEGKPVWEGDELFFPNGDKIYVFKSVALSIAAGGLYDLSWNQPKPKTVMVELTVEDAQWVTDIWMYQSATHPGNISRACRKALEGVK